MMNMTMLLVFFTVSSITAQTFQYSRGWTNGKRDGHAGDDLTTALERVLNPCQLRKIKYLLDGMPITDRFYSPCVYRDEDKEVQNKRYKAEHNHESLFDVFQ